MNKKVVFTSVAIVALILAAYLFKPVGEKLVDSKSVSAQPSQEAPSSQQLQLGTTNNAKDKKITPGINICADDIVLSLSPELAREYVRHIGGLLFDVDASNIPIKSVNEILTRTGIGKNRGYKILSDINDESISPVVPRDAKFFRQNETQKIIERINSEKTHLIFDDLRNKNLSKEKLLIVDGEINTLASLLLNQEGSEYDTILANVVESNIPIYLTDLINFTLSKSDVDELEMLLGSYIGNINHSFYFEGDLHNLATLSAAKILPLQFKYWVEQGVPFKARKYGKNAADYFIENGGTNSEELIVSTLKYYNIEPNEPINLEHFTSINRNTGKVVEASESVDNKGLVNSYIAKIFNIVAKGVTPPENCRISEKEFRSIVEQTFVIANQVEESNESRIVDTKLVKEVDEIFSERTVDKESFENNDKSHLSAEETEKLERQAELIRDGKWKEVLEEQLSEVDVTNQEELSASLNLAILGGCSKKDIVEILTKLDFVEPRLAKVVVKNCDVSVLETFFRYGLHFNYVYQDGTNAVLTSVMVNSIEKLDFLIKAGVTVNNGEPSQEFDDSYAVEDPLSFAILSLTFEPFYKVIIEKLLLNGAIISDKHFLLVKKIADFDFDTYMGLLEDFPQLKS